MRLGLNGWLALVPMSVALVSLATTQPSEAKTHKHHHHHKAACCSKKANNIVDVASKNGSFKTLVADLKTAKLCGVLEGNGPFTVFAPDDAAFGKLGKANGLTEDPEKLAKVLKYHVVKGNLSAADLAGKKSVTTLEGESLMINNKDGKVIVDGAIVTTPDVKASNGTIHIIDTVLSPERGK